MGIVDSTLLPHDAFSRDTPVNRLCLALPTTFLRFTWSLLVQAFVASRL